MLDESTLNTYSCCSDKAKTGDLWYENLAIDDAKALIEVLHIANEQELLLLVAKYVPQERVDVWVQYLIAGLFEP